jgi:hypothetical protein
MTRIREAAMELILETEVHANNTAVADHHLLEGIKIEKEVEIRETIDSREMKVDHRKAESMSNNQTSFKSRHQVPIDLQMLLQLSNKDQNPRKTIIKKILAI